MNKNFVVYKATFPNNKSYIGITSNLVRRIRRHKNDSRTSNLAFHRAIRKYGMPTFEILTICQTWDEVCRLEISYIETYQTFKTGYNLTKGGEGVLGTVMSDSAKKHLSKMRTGNLNPQYGKRQSKEYM